MRKRSKLPCKLCSMSGKTWQHFFKTKTELHLGTCNNNLFQPTPSTVRKEKLLPSISWFVQRPGFVISFKKTTYHSLLLPLPGKLGWLPCHERTPEGPSNKVCHMRHCPLLFRIGGTMALRTSRFGLSPTIISAIVVLVVVILQWCYQCQNKTCMCSQYTWAWTTDLARRAMQAADSFWKIHWHINYRPLWLSVGNDIVAAAVVSAAVLLAHFCTAAAAAATMTTEITTTQHCNQSVSVSFQCYFENTMFRRISTTAVLKMQRGGGEG